MSYSSWSRETICNSRRRRERRGCLWGLNIDGEDASEAGDCLEELVDGTLLLGFLLD